MSTQDDAAKELEHALSTLTTEERAAYDEGQAEGDDTTATVEETEAAAAAAADKESKDAPKPVEASKPAAVAGDTVDDGAAAASTGKPEDAASATPAATTATEPPAAPAPAQAAQHSFVAEAPADATEKLAKIAADKADLAAKWDAGDVTAVEYQTQLDGLYRDERKIEAAVLKHEMATEMATQAKMNAWTAECNAFMGANPQYSADPALFGKLNTYVKALGADGSMSDSQALAEAHKMVQMQAGTYAPPERRADDKTKPAAPAVKPELPPSLGGLPSAGAMNPGESRFSAIDRLEGEAFEAAFAKLSAADRDAYMQQ